MSLTLHHISIQDGSTVVEARKEYLDVIFPQTLSYSYLLANAIGPVYVPEYWPYSPSPDPKPLEIADTYDWAGAGISIGIGMLGFLLVGTHSSLERFLDKKERERQANQRNRSVEMSPPASSNRNSASSTRDVPSPEISPNPRNPSSPPSTASESQVRLLRWLEHRILNFWSLQH